MIASAFSVAGNLWTVAALLGATEATKGYEWGVVAIMLIAAVSLRSLARRFRKSEQ